MEAYILRPHNKDNYKFIKTDRIKFTVINGKLHIEFIVNNEWQGIDLQNEDICTIEIFSGDEL